MRTRKRKGSRVRAALLSGTLRVRRNVAVRRRAMRHAVGAALASLAVAFGQIVGAQAQQAPACLTMPGLVTAAFARPGHAVALEGGRPAVTLTTGMMIGGQPVIVTLIACGSRGGSEAPATVTVVVEVAGSLGQVKLIAGWRPPLLQGS